MLETKQQKQIFAGSLVLIFILSMVSFWHKPNFNYVDTSNRVELSTNYKIRQEAYKAYLASLNTTPESQEKFFKEIVPESEIRLAIEKELDVNQKIVIPVINDNEIKIVKTTGKIALEKYISQSAPIIEKIKNLTDASVEGIYDLNGDVSKVESLYTEVTKSISQLKNTPVPTEAVVFHKQVLIGLNSYLDLLNSSKSYTVGLVQNPWANTYKNTYIITEVNNKAETEFNNLNLKYKLVAQDDSNPQSWFVPVANAQLATIDVWAKAKEALNEVVATAIARFMLAFLDKLANKIEEAYRVSNFLYYSDALVSGQYADDYLNKYVKDPLDRVMIKNFIPQVNCGNVNNYSTVFKAKADTYLGFDPSSLDPNDPDYYEKLTKVGNFLSQPGGWELYYKDIASQAQSVAEQAAGAELNSPGQKTARDVVGNIITPVAVSVSTLQGIFTRYLSEGRSDQQSTVVEKVTSQITQTFLNSFVFKGVVLQEQKACIPIPQVKLLSGVGTEPAP